ncbi:shikimate dehydrogenase, partial [Mycobacterium tuberculosis]|nr:shikimate dehydrogenase [Mycobacterium tuberculosis]
MLAPAPRRAGVVGWPVAHSRSPLIHGYWLQQLGIAGSYDRIPVPPEEIERFFADLPTSGLAGCNVTVPHKEAAFAAADRLDDIALAIGAVNTLWLEEGRRLATNTDGPGFLANLDAALP